MSHQNPEEKKRRGRPLVVSAVSGGGKSTICRRLLELYPDLGLSISHTTRPPRGRERDGVEYFFVSRPVFERMIEAGGFVEWAEVHGELYGTSRAQLDAILASGRDALLDIDIQGGFQIKKLYPESWLVFVLPPSFEVLLERLRNRATESEEKLRRRLNTAVEELRQAVRYEYFIVNDVLEEAVEDMQKVRLGQKSRQVPEKLIFELRDNILKYLNN